MPAVWAGLIAGAVFLLVEMMLVATIGGGSLWGPPRMMAAIVMGQGVLPPPATFDFGVVMAAMAVHFVLSVLYGFVLAFLIFRLDLKWALAAGAGFGLALYLVNFYLFTAAFPWFAMARGGITLFAHLVFGVVLAWSYKALARRESEHEIAA
jgi:hypothetical protein